MDTSAMLLQFTDALVASPSRRNGKREVAYMPTAIEKQMSNSPDRMLDSNLNEFA